MALARYGEASARPSGVAARRTDTGGSPGADIADSERYDPRFGDAFYTGAWDAGFDHEATLAAITAPTVYLHAKVDHDEWGILRGAADDHDAARISSLLPNATFVQTDTGHDIHNEDPDLYVRALRDLTGRLGRPG